MGLGLGCWLLGLLQWGTGALGGRRRCARDVRRRSSRGRGRREDGVASFGPTCARDAVAREASGGEVAAAAGGAAAVGVERRVGAAVVRAANRAADGGANDDHDGDDDRGDAPARAVPRRLGRLLVAVLELPLFAREAGGAGAVAICGCECLVLGG